MSIFCFTYYCKKLKEIICLLVECLFYCAFVFLFLLFICKSFEEQFRFKRIRIFQTFITYFFICLLLQVTVDFYCHFFTFKVLGYQNYNRRKTGIKAISYIKSIVYILLMGVIGYSFFLNATESEMNNFDLNFKSITNICSLLIGFIVLYVNYYNHYLKYFTKESEESVLNNYLLRG